MLAPGFPPDDLQAEFSLGRWWPLAVLPFSPRFEDFAALNILTRRCAATLKTRPPSDSDVSFRPVGKMSTGDGVPFHSQSLISQVIGSRQRRRGERENNVMWS